MSESKITISTECLVISIVRSLNVSNHDGKLEHVLV